MLKDAGLIHYTVYAAANKIIVGDLMRARQRRDIAALVKYL